MKIHKREWGFHSFSICGLEFFDDVKYLRNKWDKITCKNCLKFKKGKSK
jgi:hypothetical protein